ncbi:hypothetical protein [Streptomyces sp. BP-8]|uniref:Uncharacterized protein n=1 Tax=Streptomyces sirii TaxID=3127701 RepID=A0ABZ2QJ79_9ACTN
MRAKVTLGYAGDADTSWMEDLAVEELEMVSEQVDEDLRALDEGEHVSGPSAQEYQRRVRKAAAVFAGRVVNQADNAQRLLTSKHPDIHHGLGDSHSCGAPPWNCPSRWRTSAVSRRTPPMPRWCTCPGRADHAAGSRPRIQGAEPRR